MDKISKGSIKGDYKIKLMIKDCENLCSYIRLWSYNKFWYNRKGLLLNVSFIYYDKEKNIISLIFIRISFIFDIIADKLKEFFLLINKHKYKNLIGLLLSFFNIIADPPLSNRIIFYIIFCLSSFYLIDHILFLLEILSFYTLLVTCKS